MGDDIMLSSTSQFEQLKLEDKTVTECEIFKKSTVVKETKERLTEEVNAFLTDDLIDEIFARLPIKTLICFRSLSKSWYTRIYSPDFICKVTMNTPYKVLIQHVTVKAHRIREFIYTLHSEDKLPVCPIVGYTDITPAEFTSPFPRIDIIGSCNGIVCLYRRRPGFILCNFSIRREVKIPDHPFMREYEKNCETSLGFGFHPITKDYNIVGIFYDGTVHASFIYSLQRNSWRKINFPTRPKLSVMPRAILFNGALHWVATETSSNIRERMILTFNLSSHVFGTISLPEPSRRAEKLTVLNGCLGVISRKRWTTWIWVMREYGNVASWSLVHELDMKRFNRVRVIKALSNGGLLFGISKFSSSWYTVYYPETRVLSELLKFKGTCVMLDMEMYVESFELLDKGTPCGNTISLNF